MYLENVKAKILSAKNYQKKNKMGNRTDELGIIGLVLMFDIKEHNTLNNSIMPAILAKPKDDSFEKYEIEGYKGFVDLTGVQFGQDVVINADIPMKNDFSEFITLYDMKLF